MVQRIFWTCALVLCSSCVHALEIGQRAPEVVLNDLPGVSKLSDLRGRYVYVDFWASWCGPCRISFPWLATLQSRYKSEELTVLAINLDKQRRDADRFLKAQPPAFAVAYDASGDAARQFELKTMPSSYLLGPDGRVLYTHRGFTTEDIPRLNQDIERLVRK